MEIETNHGGLRRKSGRKKVHDKKVTVSIYPRLSRIETIGIEGVREVATKAVEKEYFKLVK